MKDGGDGIKKEERRGTEETAFLFSWRMADKSERKARTMRGNMMEDERKVK